MSQSGGQHVRSVLITGAAGAFGRVLVPLLSQRGFRVHAVDRSPWPGCPKEVAFHRVDILKRGFDDVLRRERPAALVHLAMIHRFGASASVLHAKNNNPTAMRFISYPSS